jgi:7-carboxy-7-deazaguanine synthase
MKYGVNEIFHTIQGEGILAGTPATFVRLQGCTVGCPWCDTKYTWMAGGKVMSQDDLAEVLRDTIRPLVVVTGGEPTIYNLDDLFDVLRTLGQRRWAHSFRIQIETSGQNNFKGELRPDYVTWSPKHNLGFDAPIEIKSLATEVKWVVDDDLLIENVQNRMHEVGLLVRRQTTCILMPEGCPPSQEHVDKAMLWLADNLTWRFGDRLQWRIGVK